MFSVYASPAPNPPPQTSTGSQIQTKDSPQPGVQIIESNAPAESVLTSRKGSYSFQVQDGDWQDTGVVVAPGDHLAFTTTGTLSLSDGRSADPNGVARGWKDLLRIFPLNSSNVGAFVGRIGTENAAVPFSIGASKEMDIHTSGHLFLRANISTDLTADGTFHVEMKLSKAKDQNAAKAAAVQLSTLVSPALFSETPRRVQDEQHDPGDMVNFALIGTQDQVQKAFAAAGWVQVDKTTQDAVLHGLLATLSHEAYTQMPMSILYLFGRPQDLSYARADPLEVAAIRNHLRVWKTMQTVDGKPLWVGSATHDNGFETDRRNGGVTHHIDPNVDAERDFIEQSFSDAGIIIGAVYVTPANPLRSASTATGGSFHSDGRIVVMMLH